MRRPTVRNPIEGPTVPVVPVEEEMLVLAPRVPATKEAPGPRPQSRPAAPNPQLDRYYTVQVVTSQREGCEKVKAAIDSFLLERNLSHSVKVRGAGSLWTVHVGQCATSKEADEIGGLLQGQKFGYLFPAGLEPFIMRLKAN